MDVLTLPTPPPKPIRRVADYECDRKTVAARYMPEFLDTCRKFGKSRGLKEGEVARRLAYVGMFGFSGPHHFDALSRLAEVCGGRDAFFIACRSARQWLHKIETDNNCRLTIESTKEAIHAYALHLAGRASKVSDLTVYPRG